MNSELPNVKSHQVDSRINYLLLATALLGTFFSGTATRIVAISMPTVARSLETDLIGVSWALLAYQLSNIGLSLVFGRVADLWGREKIFALGFVVFALSSLLCGLSQTVTHLILSRFAQGVGGALLQSSSRALAAESVPEEIGGRAQGYMTTAHHVGFVLGPSIGGLMIDYLSWRWSFFFLVPIGLCGALLTAANFKRNGSRAERPNVTIDYAGAVLLFATTTTLVLILDRRMHEMIGLSWKITLAGMFLGLLAALILHESKAKSPFLNLELFKIPMFRFSVLSLLIMALCYSLITFLMPFYLQGILHFTPTAVGLFFMAPSFITIALAPISGSMSDRLGPRTPATLGAAIMVVALGSGAWLQSDSHWLAPASLIVLGSITNGLFNPANSTAMIGMMPKEHRGFASSMNHVTFGLGNVLGVAMGGFVMAIAFEQYTGVSGLRPTTERPVEFVSAFNSTFLAAALVSLGAVGSSLAR